MQVKRRNNRDESQEVNKSAASVLNPDGSQKLNNKKERLTTTATTASEEDVFARLVTEEVTRSQSSAAQTGFADLVAKQVKIRTRNDGSVNWEKVMKGALKWASSEKQNLISRSDAEGIYSRTFAASQLDSNTDSLDDTTVKAATMESDQAFSKARVTLEKLVSGEQQTSNRSLFEKVTSSVKKSEKIDQTITSDLTDILLSNTNFQI